MHCVKAIAPASFGALMQLPREQLKELIDKQPSIKPALYQYVVQKAGVAKAQSLADVSGQRLEKSIVCRCIRAHYFVMTALWQPSSSYYTATTHLYSHLKCRHDIMA